MKKMFYLTEEVRKRIHLVQPRAFYIRGEKVILPIAEVCLG